MDFKDELNFRLPAEAISFTRRIVIIFKMPRGVLREVKVLFCGVQRISSKFREIHKRL